MWKQDHLTTLTYHNNNIIPMLCKIFHSFADNPSHAVPRALAIASELAISLWRWSNIDNWHAECVYLVIEKRDPFIYHVFEKLSDPFIYLIVENFDLYTIIYKYFDFLSCVCQQKSALKHGCPKNFVIHRLNMEKWGHSYILT